MRFTFSELCGILMVPVIGAGSVCAADWSIGVHQGVPQIHCDGKPVSSRFFHANIYYGMNPEGIDSPVFHEVELAGKAGVDLFSLSTMPIWTEEELNGESAYALTYSMDNVIAANPRVKVLVRIALNPPGWWAKSHMDSMARLNNGWVASWLFRDAGKPDDIRKGICPSLSSPDYMEFAEAALRRTIRFLEKRYPDSIIGYHPTCLSTGEWTYNSLYRPFTEGYDPWTKKQFAQVIRTKYQTEGALRKAWNDPQVTFASVTIPAHEERSVPAALRAPKYDRKLIDYYTFINEVAADTVIRFSKVCKEEAPNRLAASFFGYVQAMSSSWWGGAGKGGQMSFRKVLDSPYVDIFCAPFNYDSRSLDGPLMTQGVPESVHAAGKLWLNEDDTGTYIAGAVSPRGPEAAGGSNTRKGTIDLLRRGLAWTTARNTAIWWMDLHGVGWFYDPYFWREMARFKPFVDEGLLRPHPYEPEFGVAADQRSLLYYIGYHERTPGHLAPPDVMMRLMTSSNRCGFAAGGYLQEDVLAGKAASLKFCAFPSAYVLDAQQRTALTDYRRTHGVLWAWAPGYVDLETGDFSLEAVRETTGFRVRRLDRNVTLRVFSTEEGKKLGLPAQFGFAPKVPIDPVLSPETQPGDKVLANYSDGNPAVVLRRENGFPNLFCGTTEVPVPLIRHVAELSGVHCYTAETNAEVYVRGDYLAIYSPVDRTQIVFLKTPGSYRDWITGKTLGSGKRLAFEMKRGQTVVLENIAR